MGLCTEIMIIALLVGTLTVVPALSVLTDTTVIGTTGTIRYVGEEVTAASGSPSDIQTAVNQVASAGGGIVYIPAGDFEFNPNTVQIPGGVSVIGAGKDVTVLRQTIMSSSSTSMFKVDGRNHQPSRISGITFIGYGEGEAAGGSSVGVNMYNCKNFRVDHCKFIDFDGTGVSTGVYSVDEDNGQYYWNTGVIDHCDFDNPYKDTVGGVWGYGVQVHGPGRPDAWLYDADEIMGKFPANPPNCALYQWNSATNQYDLVSQYGGKQFRWLVYVEDCSFSRCRHSIASSNGAWYVARYNTFQEGRPENYPMVDIHGALDIDWWGGRGAEIYNNIFIGANSATSPAIDYRGGSGVVFGNTITDCQYGVRLSYDADQQVCWIDNLWIWNNDFQNVPKPINHWYNPTPYVEDVDYFLTAKSGYTSYSYPHPLTLE